MVPWLELLSFCPVIVGVISHAGAWGAVFIMSVSIALGTYNGERFLQELLDSVAAQAVRPGEMVVCDDASTDGTVPLLRKFKQVADFPVSINVNGKRFGVVENFARALALCRGEYIALCDQDDIWLPEKLSLLLDAMLNVEGVSGKNMPVLVHSDLIVADVNGSLLAPSFLRMQNLRHIDFQPLWTLIVQNFVTGCTIMLNRALLEAALPIPEAAVMHDWWLALVAAARGRIVFVPEPAVLYRQHGSNVVGARRFYSVDNLMKLYRLKEAEKSVARAFSQGNALQERLGALGQRCEDLEILLGAVATGGARALKTLRMEKVSKQGFLRNLLFYLLVAKGGYKQFL